MLSEAIKESRRLLEQDIATLERMTALMRRGRPYVGPPLTDRERKQIRVTAHAAVRVLVNGWL